jgi:hypothetical protein
MKVREREKEREMKREMKRMEFWISGRKDIR